MAELRDSLQTAIQQRLQLAIFNSCDGLGIAAELESLHIPQVIVMREPVPDFVAQEFLKYFLEAFTNGRSLCIAVGYARRQLAMLEDDFPCASWLPVIVQNQLEMPPTWQSLGVTRSPYRGLMAFREEDTDNFFGREAFVEQLLIDVNRKALVAVIGASGSGKSSVVFAGLIPQLRRDENRQWQIISFRPGKNPFESLAVALMGSGEIVENRRYQELELEVELKRDISALARIIADMFGDGSRVLLVVDQFEEIYTLCSNLKERQIFIDGLLNICVDEQFSTTVVMTLRADFLGKAMSYQPLGKALQDFPPSLLVPMSRAELESAIIQPAARYSVELEEGLVDKLIDDVGAGEGSLPLQQFALTQLWGKQRPGLLTHQAYTEIGGVTQAVANHAEAVYAGLSEEQQKRAQRLFIQLVQPGEGTEDTRRLATRDEVGDDWDLVTLLANERLLVTNRNELVGNTVEVVHEALIRSWGHLRGWMDDNREFRVWQERLKVALQQWVDSNKDDGGLLRGATLAVAEDWLQKRRTEVSKAQRRFIEKSIRLRERERKHRENLRWRVIGGLAFGLVLALSLAGIAQIRETNARLITGKLSAEALLASNNDLDALVEAVRSAKLLQYSFGVHTDIKIQTVATLQKVVYKVKERNRLNTTIEFDKTSLEAHDFLKELGFRCISFNSNRNIIASSNFGGIITLWNFEGKILKTIKTENLLWEQLSFSPDGKTIIASGNGIIKFWNLHGELLKTIRVLPHELNINESNLEYLIIGKGKPNFFCNVHFTSDSSILLCAANNGTVKLWNLDGEVLKTFKIDSYDVVNTRLSESSKDDINLEANTLEITKYLLQGQILYPITFSPNTKIIAAVGANHTIKLWSLEGKLLQTIRDPQSEQIEILSFSPDGKTLASGSSSGKIKLWNLEGKLIKAFQAHSNNFNNIMFSPNSATIVSSGFDKTIKLWNLEGKLLQIFKGDEVILDGLGFSLNTKNLVIGSKSTIKIMNLENQKIQTIKGDGNAISHINFTSNGKNLIAGGYGVIKYWNIQKQLLQIFNVNGGWIRRFAFSYDGKIITSFDDQNVINSIDLQKKQY
ncbi:MAG: myosin kinase [Richelia sp. SL_2_1]|nr:myosin kinase [Richelia sp. SL_2_1]